MKLYNSTQLARAAGIGLTKLCAAKRAGYQMRYGTRDTLSNLLRWFANNPDFRTSNGYYYPAQPRKPKEEAAA